MPATYKKVACFLVVSVKKNSIVLRFGMHLMKACVFLYDFYEPLDCTYYCMFLFN